MAAVLQQATAAGQQLVHTGPLGFSTLHAAVVCGRTSELAALAAAGAPLDGAADERPPDQIRIPESSLRGKLTSFLRDEAGVQQSGRTGNLYGVTPLATAVQ